MAKVGKLAGGDRNRARAGRTGWQVGKQTNGANGTGAGSSEAEAKPSGCYVEGARCLPC